ncbi:8-amino-7-oxononanoate synthase [Melanogaster broomeanus]|nr:8-amino-7-oxononanoate synthase [Melanogaster broomeanus]
MSQDSPLLYALQRAIAHRVQTGLSTFCLDEPLPSSAADLFSNDYLSLTTDPVLREIFLQRLLGAPRLFGSTGSRIATGNSEECNALETRFHRFFGAPSALLFNSGFTANMGFFGSVPQSDDVIIYDELIHASCREGFRISAARNALYPFAHNSVASFEECLRNVLSKQPQIIHGKSTVFVSLESVYSMDGDFCPLAEIVQLIEDLVPAGHAHIVVDEAHSTGICGPNGSGYVSLLGLNHRVHTQVHVFSKAFGLYGAVVLTSPIVREYMIQSAKSFVFSTAMPYTDLYALQASLDVISSDRGQELRQNLLRLSRYAHKQVLHALKCIPGEILSVDNSPSKTHDSGLCSPIIGISTPLVRNLADFLLKKGYAVTPFTHPIVRRPKIRVVIHAHNTEEEIDSFVNALVQWSTMQGQDGVPAVVGSGMGADRQYMKGRARL